MSALLPRRAALESIGLGAASVLAGGSRRQLAASAAGDSPPPVALTDAQRRALRGVIDEGSAGDLPGDGGGMTR